ncbi:Translationally-controlled tumor protein [Tupaia chinensis]|uniref:Translationally-controlled tumor protein n=1 Tax=Tupaia chinensis TaxID=246437 RepID=L8Y586_TUPCH|nr:Translationally-controlled tumor protein [Tupaia chinensis]
MIIYRDLISRESSLHCPCCGTQGAGEGGPAAVVDLGDARSRIWGEEGTREVADGLCLEVEGKMVSRTEGNIDDSLIGGNASAEGPEGEGTESTVVTGVDIVMNHHLQETSFTKEAYKKYIKDYMKSIKGKLEEQRPERVKPFMTGAAEQIKHILANFKNYQFFIGENMNPDGMVALLDYREDGVTPYMIFFKDGLEMGKCVSMSKRVEIV